MKNRVKVWVLLLCLLACGRAMSLPYGGPVSEYAAYIQLDLASVTNDHTITVKDNITGATLTPGSGIPVTSATPPGLITLPLAPVPHSNSITLKIECTDPAGGVVTLLALQMPHDTLAPYNLTSTACNADGYNYGFNGQMKTNEIAGLGNHNSALYWEYDTRTGRRWNVDPVYKEFESPYSTFSNRPIQRSDVKGDDGVS